LLVVPGLLLVGCGKGETGGKTASASSSGSAATAKGSDFVVPTEAPTERARQRIEREAAASKLLDVKKPEEKKPDPVKPDAKVEPPALAKADAKPEAKPAAAAAAPAASPAPAAAVVTPPAAAPAPTQVAYAPPATPARAEPAKEIPKAEPAKAVSTAPRVLSREEPTFPREAVQAGVREGRVLARMSIDGRGNVTKVDIVSAEPRRVFDRAVQRALSQWKFDAGADGRTADTEVVFRE
jgi:protein TonB